MSESPAPAARPGPSAGRARFRERLSVPWWWWPIGLGVAALIAAEVHLGYPGVRAWLPYLLTGPLAIAALVWLGRHRVGFDGAELRVGPAHLPVRYIGRVDVVDPVHKRRTLGPDLDPAAFVLHRGWVRPLVRVQIVDDADPTPYWLFSSRRAGELAALLRSDTTDSDTTDSGPAAGSTEPASG